MTNSPAPASAPRRRRAWLIIFPILLVGLAIFAWPKLRYALAHEETDNAQIEAHISPLLPRVPGFVAKVLVDDNQTVTAGQPLIEIDATELDVKIAAANTAVENARAGLRTAEAGLLNAKAGATFARANIVTAKITAAKAKDDLARDTTLAQTGALTERQLLDTRAASETSAAQLDAISRQAESAEAEIAVAEAKIAAAKSEIAQREADLAFAQLQRSYATLKAPISGVVSRKNVEPGQFVQAGQTLLLISEESAPWVVANFKETQLAKMRVGQPVDVVVDTYPGYTFHGKVASLAGATGARFALLPPDNATGNFVKVTQRVPVKIVLDPANENTAHPLRAGLSVRAAVLVKPVE